MRQIIKPFWLIFIIWILALFIINPIGDFPLNDDWAYGWSVNKWLESGEFQIIDWPAMSLFSHVAWGTLWAKIFGFSFTTLRFSVILLAIFSIWICSLLFKGLEFSWGQQVIGLATFVFNPMYFYLSNTFMTDVSFLSFCILSIYGFWRYFSSEKWFWWGIAIFFSILAILVRQLGILIPIAFGVAMILRKPAIKNISVAISGILLTFFSLKGYLWWLENTTGLPASFVSIDSVISQLNPPIFWERTKDLLGFYFIYLGGFLMPLWMITTKRFTNRIYLLLFLIGLPMLGFFLLPCWDKLPLWNTIYDLGIGPMNLPDFIRGHTDMRVLSNWQNLLIKVLGYLGAILLLWNGVHGLSRIWQNRQSDAPVFYFRIGILLFMGSFLMYLITDRYNFDRYMLPLFVFSFFLFPKTEEKNIWPAVFILLPLLFFTIGGTHDYLAWNKARWEALNELQGKGILPNEIDGGFEFNGWHQTHTLNPQNPYSKSWWFVDDDRYAIAFTPYKNYKVIAKFPFKRYLTFGRDSVLVLQRPSFQQSTIINESKIRPTDSLFVSYKKEDYLAVDLPSEIRNIDSSTILQIQPTKKYALQHKLFPVKPFEKISISFDLYGNKKSFKVVTSAPSADDFYHAHLPYLINRDKDNWQKIVVEMEIPHDYPSDTLKIYLWKQKEKDPLFIRNFELEWRRF